MILSIHKNIKFTLPLPKHNVVFMHYDMPNFNKKNEAIVIVDAEKFLDLWRRSIFYCHTLGNVNPRDYSNDYKIHKVTRFLKGIEYSTPIINVSLHLESFYKKTPNWTEKHMKDAIGFSDGVTRTKWLFSHRCPAFPVSCSVEQKENMHRLLAVQNTRFYGVEELENLEETEHIFVPSKSKFFSEILD